MTTETETAAAVIKQHMTRMIAQLRIFSWCTVLSYDDDGHRVKVRLQPEGHIYDHIPVLVMFRGQRTPHVANMQGVCLCWWGVPQVLLGVTYTTRDQIPARGITMEEDLYVGGDVRLSGGLYPGVAPELPPAQDMYRYAMVTVSERATGLPNARPAVTYQCLPSADGSLHWSPVATAP